MSVEPDTIVFVDEGEEGCGGEGCGEQDSVAEEGRRVGIQQEKAVEIVERLFDGVRW